MRRISKILFLAILVISLMFFSRTSQIFAATEKIDAGDYSDYQEIDDETNKASTPSAVTNNTNKNNANVNTNTNTNANANKANNNSNNTANENSNNNSKSNIANTATTSHPQTGIYNTSVCVAIATVVVSFIVVSYVKLKKYNY